MVKVDNVFRSLVLCVLVVQIIFFIGWMFQNNSFWGSSYRILCFRNTDISCKDISERSDKSTDNIPLSMEDWNTLKQVGAVKARTDLINLSHKSISDDRFINISNRDIMTSIPTTYDCDMNYLQRIGSSNDGGKWICTNFLPSDKDLVMISIGSRGDFSFEQDILSRFPGIIYTFDCTGNWKPPSPRIKFYSICIGTKKASNFYGWKEMLDFIKVDQVDLLKLDVEGSEWSILPEILTHKPPKQISFELHLDNYSKRRKSDSIGKLRQVYTLFNLLAEADYYVHSKEFNIYAPVECCMEYTVVRILQEK